MCYPVSLHVRRMTRVEIDTHIQAFAGESQRVTKLLLAQLRCLHYIDERPDRNSTARSRNFASSAVYNREELRFPSDPPQGSENHSGEDGGDDKPTPKLVHAPDSNTVAQSRGPIGRWILEPCLAPGHRNIRIGF
jgi:hypothetical protein